VIGSPPVRLWISECNAEQAFCLDVRNDLDVCELKSLIAEEVGLAVSAVQLFSPESMQQLIESTKLGHYDLPNEALIIVEKTFCEATSSATCSFPYFCISVPVT